MEKRSRMRIAKIHFSAMFAPDRLVVHSTLYGLNSVHIREYISIDNCYYPTLTGVCFSIAQLIELVDMFGTIDDQLNRQDANGSFMFILKGDFRLVIPGEKNGLDFFRGYASEGVQRDAPSKTRIFVPISQWSMLKAKLREVIHRPLMFVSDEKCSHPNQKKLRDCQDCFPADSVCNVM